MNYYALNNQMVHGFASEEDRDNYVRENQSRRSAVTTSDPFVRRALRIERENRPTEYGGVWYH